MTLGVKERRNSLMFAGFTWQCRMREQFPKFRSNPLFYLNERPAIIDFSAVLRKFAENPATVKAESEQESA